MKTLILYATKYGASKEIASRIAKKMDNATICDIKRGEIPPLADFDCIIVGSSVYAGSIRKEAADFVNANDKILCEKTLGIFLSGIGADETSFSKNFPQNMLASVKSKVFLGGIFDPAKANGFERLIMKMVTKQKGYMETIDDEAIVRFVAAINEGGAME